MRRAWTGRHPSLLGRIEEIDGDRPASLIILECFIKSDRCPWCKKFVAVLDSLKEQNNTILGKVIIRENGPSIKAAVGPVVEASL